LTTRASLHFPDEPQPTRRGVKARFGQEVRARAKDKERETEGGGGGGPRECKREDLVIEEQSVDLGRYTRDFGVRVWGQGVGFGV